MLTFGFRLFLSMFFLWAAIMAFPCGGNRLTKNARLYSFLAWRERVIGAEYARALRLDTQVVVAISHYTDVDQLAIIGALAKINPRFKNCFLGNEHTHYRVTDNTWGYLFSSLFGWNNVARMTYSDSGDGRLPVFVPDEYVGMSQLMNGKRDAVLPIFYDGLYREWGNIQDANVNLGAAYLHQIKQSSVILPVKATFEMPTPRLKFFRQHPELYLTRHIRPHVRIEIFPPVKFDHIDGPAAEIIEQLTQQQRQLVALMK
jgi:hypothetical protein